MNILSRKIGYQFQKIYLLKAALRHRSVRGHNNERLEFLGDAVLNFVITATLYAKYPHATEGELSRLRANLVKGETLAVLAAEFDLGRYVVLGPSELRTGGSSRKSILADTVEAILGAIYLDGGLAACEQCILNWYDQRLSERINWQAQKDAKSRLQEYLQAQQLSLPSYSITKIEGKGHQQVFYVACEVAEVDIATSGSGTNRRAAEQQAAEIFLQALMNK
jgi:ribonuclease-3